MSPDEIRAWRKRLGLSQVRAANELGVGERYMQFMEAGDRAPSQTLANLMRCLEKQSISVSTFD